MEMSSSITSILQALHIVPTPSNRSPPHKSFPRQPTNGLLPSGLREITLAEVADHDAYTDCWIVLYDRVYDVSKFLRIHPGGEDVIMDHAGRDATLAFHGTGHSQDAIEQMRDYLIGELPPKERIFRTSHGRVITSGIPD